MRNAQSPTVVYLPSSGGRTGSRLTPEVSVTSQGPGRPLTRFYQARYPQEISVSPLQYSRGREHGREGQAPEPRWVSFLFLDTRLSFFKGLPAQTFPPLREASGEVRYPPVASCTPITQLRVYVQSPGLDLRPRSHCGTFEEPGPRSRRGPHLLRGVDLLHLCCT